MAPTSIPKDESHVTKFIVVSTVLYTIALIMFMSRMWIRNHKTHFHPAKVRIEDWALVVAMAFGTVLYGMNLYVMSIGMGRHIYYLEPHNIPRAIKFSIFMAECCLWGNSATKVSVTIMLIRIHDGKVWRRCLYGLLTFLICQAIAACFWDLLQCRPLSALWDQSLPRDLCIPREMYRDWIYAVTCFHMITDLILSLLALFLIKTVLVHRPLREKVVLCILMALGIFCACGAIPKLTTLRSYATEIDVTWMLGNVFMWAQVELYVGITVACVPALRSAFENTLRWLGLLSTADQQLQEGKMQFVHGDWNSRTASTSDKQVVIQVTD